MGDPDNLRDERKPPAEPGLSGSLAQFYQANYRPLVRLAALLIGDAAAAEAIAADALAVVAAAVREGPAHERPARGGPIRGGPIRDGQARDTQARGRQVRGGHRRAGRISSTTEHATPEHSTADHSTTEHTAIDRSTPEHSTAAERRDSAGPVPEHSTAERATTEHSNTEHSTAGASTPGASTPGASTPEHTAQGRSPAEQSGDSQITAELLARLQCEVLARCRRSRSYERAARRQGRPCGDFEQLPVVLALRSLQANLREAIVLTHYLNLPEARAAAIAGISEAALRANVAAALQMLDSQVI